MANEALVADGSGDAADALGGVQNLAYYETIIDRGLGNQESAALALFQIHEQKLYRETYGSFKNYLKQRWDYSRARGYQMLNFARHLRVSTRVDVANERQARRLDAEGNVRRAREEDVTSRAMNYLSRTFERLPPGKRRKFTVAIRQLMAEMDHQLNQDEQSEGRLVAPS